MIGERSAAFLVVLVAVPLALAGCPPSDADFVRIAKEQVAQNCCSVNKDDMCIHCKLLEGAKVTSVTLGNGDAASGRRVQVDVDGPNGAGTCYYGIGFVGGGGLASAGGTCRPKGAPTPP